MKLKSRFTLCTSAVAGDNSDDNHTPATSTATSPNSSNNTSSSSLHSNLSLQTLPSVPSLQTLSLLDNTIVTLTHTLTSSLTLPSSITSLSLSSSLLYASSGHEINVYEYNSCTLTRLEAFNSNQPSSGAVKSIAFSSDRVLTAHQDGKIRVWKKVTEAKRRHKLVTTLPTLSNRVTSFPLPKNHVPVRRHKTRLWVEHHDAVSDLVVSSKGLIYSASWDKTVKVWNPRSLRCKESVTAHADAINAVTVSSDGTVYTGSADGRIKVWNKPGSEKRHGLVATLEKHKSAVNALALNTDGSILFSGACDRSILVWEREDNAKYMGVIGALRGHDGAILCLINVCDFLISGSADKTVRIWRRGFDGKFCCLAVLVGHKKAVKCLAARMEGEDGISVFSGGLDGEIKVWSVKINSSYYDSKLSS